MAQPSTVQRERSSARHHHRTISSTTLLLVLSLVLAVLAVLLSLPRSPAPAVPLPESTGGIFGFLSPKRDSALAGRESTVARREAEVARREAEIFGGAPSGVTLGTCMPCATATVMPEPQMTIIKEYVGGVETINPPWWKDTELRAEEILLREAKVSEREKEVGLREEVVGRRESESNRRESWIYENLMAATGDRPVIETEEFVVDDRTGRRTKELPPYVSVITETITHAGPARTVTVPAPAQTRLAAQPSPEEFINTRTEPAARTTSIEYVVDETSDDPHVHTVTVVRDRARQPGRRWFGGW